MYAKRFPIPEFNRDELKDMEWTEPTFLSKDEIAKLVERQKSGDTGAYGGYAVQADDALYAKLKLEGDHRHAIMCVLPDKPVRVVGRSYAWAIQRGLVLDSLDPDGFEALADWKTPRPMNTRLGPEDGISLDGSIVYAICCHGIGDHWVGNRTIVGREWRGMPSGQGLAIFSSYNPDVNDFHDCILYFEWPE
ncbi:MAG: hypothetical protein ACE5LB_01970 [Acidiferrobacterales bacterium]